MVDHARYSGGIDRMAVRINIINHRFNRLNKLTINNAHQVPTKYHTFEQSSFLAVLSRFTFRVVPYRKIKEGYALKPKSAESESASSKMRRRREEFSASACLDLDKEDLADSPIILVECWIDHK
jgi:hypothetical protein